MPAPDLIYWKTPSGMVLKSLPNHKMGHDSKARRSLKPWVPFGVVAFRLAADEAWRDIRTLPWEWGLTGPTGAAVVTENEDERTVTAAADAAWRNREKK